MNDIDSQTKKSDVPSAKKKPMRERVAITEQDIQNDNFRVEFGGRLRSERERMGLTQEDFARLGGVQKLAQLNYEKGERSPSAEYLNSIEPYGVDIDYLMTGRRPAPYTPPSGIDIDLLATIITKLEAALSKHGAGVVQNFKTKAFAIALLYRAFSVLGKDDVRAIEEGAEVAAKGIISETE